jgi:hypothetical protein
MGKCPSPTLWQSLPHISHCWKNSPLQAHLGGEWYYTCLLPQAYLFTVCLRKCPSPTLQWSMPLISLCWKPSLLHACWSGYATSAFSASLFIYSSSEEVSFPHSPAECAKWGSAPPLYSRAQCIPPSVLHVLFFTCLFIIQVFFFVGQGLVCPGGYAGFSQGWVWKNRVSLICSPVGLPSRLGANAWKHWSSSGFSIYSDVEELCVGWGLGSVKILPLLGGFWCVVCLQHLRKIFILRNTHYLCPLSSRHLGNSRNCYF